MNRITDGSWIDQIYLLGSPGVKSIVNDSTTEHEYDHRDIGRSRFLLLQIIRRRLYFKSKIIRKNFRQKFSNIETQ